MDTEVLGIYSCTAFLIGLLLFLLRHLLLQDHKYSKISRAADYAKQVEVAGYVFLWYGISVTFTIVNRWVFHIWHGGFPFPGLTTAVHMFVKLLITRILMPSGRRPTHLGRNVYWRTAAPIGVSTALDIMCSNASMMYITVTFYTIAKSGSLVWLLLWALVLRLQQPSWKLFVIVALICMGLAMASSGEVDFDAVGFILVLIASCLSGLRWGLTQLLKHADQSCEDALTVVYHIAPASAVAMMPVIVYNVLPFYHSEFFTKKLILDGVAIALVGGILGFLIVLVEVKLVNITSSLTMGVFGQLKEMIQIAIAVMVFQDQVTVLNLIGLLLTIWGTLLYKRFKGQEAQELAASSGPRNYAMVPEEEVEDELRVFQYTGTDWDKDGDLSDGWDDHEGSNSNSHRNGYAKITPYRI